MNKNAADVMSGYLADIRLHFAHRDMRYKRRSKGIVRIVVRTVNDHMLVDVKVVHKRTGEVVEVPDVLLRKTGLWTRQGWFTLPNGNPHSVMATIKHGEIYEWGGKYPSSPGLAMPGSAYYITGRIVRYDKLHAEPIRDSCSS